MGYMNSEKFKAWISEDAHLYSRKLQWLDYLPLKIKETKIFADIAGTEEYTVLKMKTPPPTAEEALGTDWKSLILLSFHVGQVVEVNYKNKRKWYQATITDIPFKAVECGVKYKPDGKTYGTMWSTVRPCYASTIYGVSV